MRRSNSLISSFVLLAIALMVMFSCANPVAPTGGPKDTTPPKLVDSDPPNKSINFTGKKITINFDEYVQLDNPFTKVIISPPVEKFPDIQPKGRGIVITFKEDLKPNTTYTINIGQAIKDLTEGNVMQDEPFVFSTGPNLDSLKISGMVLDAKKSQTMEDVMVLLHQDMDDSAFIKQRPYYFTKTDKTGKFTLSNLKAGKYKLYALKDANFNLMYDQQTEPIAFLKDPIIIDSSNKADYRLYLFTEPSRKNHLLETNTKQIEKISYHYPNAIHKLTVTSLDEKKRFEGALFEWNSTKDSITQWLTYSAENPKLRVVADDTIVDTILLKKRPFTVDSLKENSKLTFATSIYTLDKQNVQNIYQPLTLEFNRPVKEVDTSKILLFADTGRTQKIASIFSFSDTIHRKAVLTATLPEDHEFLLQIIRGAFTDIYGKTNDSIISPFVTLTPDDYGSLNLVLLHPNPNIQYLLTITSEQKKAVAEQTLAGQDSIVLNFKHLEPGNYILRLVMDANKNGKWDDGSFINKEQPERVYTHPSPINIKGNWDIRQEIDLKD